MHLNEIKTIITLLKLPLLISLLLTTLCTPHTHAVETAPQPTKKSLEVTFETTLGSFTIQLNKDKAPATVKNFLQYVNEGHYNETIFHRVIDGFMVQGGGFTKDMIQKKTRPPVKIEANNGLQNSLGTVAMARTNDPNSATSQFFINVNDNAFLNHSSKTNSGWGYTVFGTVTEGMDTVIAIKSVPTTTKTYYQNIPIKPVIIQKAFVK